MNKGQFIKGHKASTPPNFKDLTGQKFGKLTVIKRSYPNGKGWKVRWLCKCDCGNETILPRNNILNAHMTFT